MATTSLWAVKGYLGNLVVYIENPAKTTKAATFVQEDDTEHSRQALSDVIAYAKRDDATVSQQLVSGVNCYPKTARDEVMAVKERFGKVDGTIAYHGYQSFKPGEVTGEQAHEIGIKLAERCWGERYQVLIATHIDKDHVHNHFLINTVSHIDGRKFHRTKQDYAAMREESDWLCKEHGLSVVEPAKNDPSRKYPDQILHLDNKTLSYAEWREKRQGGLSWKEAIKADLDFAISRSLSQDSLVSRLRKMGYEIKWGKELSLKAPNRERFLRPLRHFGDDYSTDSILSKLQHNYRYGIKAKDRPTLHPKAMREVRKALDGRNPRSLATRHYHYYLLISLHKAIIPLAEQPPTLRAETMILESLMRQTMMLLEFAIDTLDQLLTLKHKSEHKLTDFQKERAKLYKIVAKSKDPEKVADAKDRLTAIKADLKPLRQTIRDCDAIAAREPMLNERIRQLAPRQREEHVR